jgi:hypothetical protein
MLRFERCQDQSFFSVGLLSVFPMLRGLIALVEATQKPQYIQTVL